ncbi:hypothetical protein [Photobacterium angustum]|uniref:hypothetical protein n=1 Tax=Photobacterium angustum TaxID=661 RepID=UPI0005E5C3A4|nr:hypothetical protein [Photobacterium angustum]KJG00106.1 hypothetical protein UB35_19845 [Photobacterium angustum]PSV61664.1 hypothetical protein CTM95_20395 [Photobacterium angustum]
MTKREKETAQERLQKKIARQAAKTEQASRNSKPSLDAVMSLSDDSAKTTGKEVLPWDNKSYAKVFQAKNDEKGLPQIGTRTNIRCPERDYEIAMWLAKNCTSAPNTTHGVIVEAMKLGLEIFVKAETAKDEWD